MIRVFCGYDAREAVGFHVFAHTLIAQSSEPVQITPLADSGLAVGSNAFTFSRFLIPALCDFKGHAIFVDGSDMIMQDDIAKLDRMFDPQYAVQVVKHQPYTTQHPRKYRGTSMECDNRNYPRKNWASVMIINCEHPQQGAHFPSKAMARGHGGVLRFEWLDERRDIGGLPLRWNVLADEGQPVDGAAILHWTAGIPAIAAHRDAPGAEAWYQAYGRMLEAP